MEEIRLNKYLSEMGLCSRREADRLIESGKVMVDGAPAVMGMKIREGQAVVSNGKPVAGTFGPKPVLLAVNKPRGVVCSNVSQGQDVNIVEYLGYPKRIMYAGRLDKDSEGLLLMTNRGDLIEQMMRGENGHEKEYEVVVDKPFTDRFLRDMEEGIFLKELGVMTRPCRVERMGKRKFRIILTQGLNRQIRRMCKELGFGVVELKRVRVMNIRLGHLKVGAYRKVTDGEYKELLRLLSKSEEGMEE